MSYVHFQVGEKFPLPIKAQGDGGLFQYDRNGAMFILKLRRTDLVAIEAFRTGKIEIALFAASDILFFLYKIDGIANNWGDCPYFVQSLPAEQQPRFDKAPEKSLNLYMVDGRLDLLLAMRTVKLTDEFHHTLTKMITEQMECGLSPADYAVSVQKLWAQYTPDEMSALAMAKQQIDLSIPAAPGKQVN